MANNQQIGQALEVAKAHGHDISKKVMQKIITAATGSQKQGLTKKQKELLDYIIKYSKANGVSPSYSTMRDHFGLASKNTVAHRVSALERRGHIRKTAGLGQSIVVL